MATRTRPPTQLRRPPRRRHVLPPPPPVERAVDPPVPVAEPDAGRDDGLGLLVAFFATTVAMVVAITALAVAGPWWVLVPVVLVHWVATYVVLERINRLLGDGS